MLKRRGSILAQTDGSGTVQALNRYDEYGVPQSTNTGFFQYTGQMWLPEIGVSNYKSRMYSPALGRFMQTDPIGPVDDANLYAYAENDPINLTDPFGLQECNPEQSIGGCGDIIINGGPSGTPQFGTLPVSVRSFAPVVPRPFDLRQLLSPTPIPPQRRRRKFSCADAMKESGQIRATGFNVTSVGVLGWTWTRGSWWNMSTGTTGRSISFGFSAGLEFAAGASVVTYKNIGAFTGGSDGYSVGAAVPLGPVAVEGSYQHSSNDSGSGSGGFGGVGAAVGIPPVGASGNFTTTEISRCTPRS